MNIQWKPFHTIRLKVILNRLALWKNHSITNWITMTRKSCKHYVWHTEPPFSCVDLIRPHEQCISWSPSLEIEPNTTKYRAKTLLLSYWSTSHTKDTKLRLECCVCVSSIFLGRRSPGEDCIICKSTDVTTRHVRLIDRAFTITC